MQHLNKNGLNKDNENILLRKERDILSIPGILVKEFFNGSIDFVALEGLACSVRRNPSCEFHPCLKFIPQTQSEIRSIGSNKDRKPIKGVSIYYNESDI